VLGSINLAVENRFKVAVFAAGGCNNNKELPEADPFNYASHVKIPVLMINGRYDSGHLPPLIPWMKETLDWPDHYLGPVK